MKRASPRNYSEGLLASIYAAINFLISVVAVVPLAAQAARKASRTSGLAAMSGCTRKLPLHRHPCPGYSALNAKSVAFEFYDMHLLFDHMDEAEREKYLKYLKTREQNCKPQETDRP
jgi:hypothetical protein